MGTQNSQTEKASWISAISISREVVLAILYASFAAITVLDIVVNSFFVKLAEFVFWPIPVIQIGSSANFFAFSSDVKRIDELPEHE